MRHSIPTFLFACLLVSCAAQEPTTDESDFRMSIPEGSQFTLTRELAVPIGWSRVTIQKGAVLDSRRNIKRKQPYCEFNTNTVAHTGSPQVVNAEKFIARRVVQRRSTIVEGGDDRTYTTSISFRSEQQPNVRGLSCEQTGMARTTDDLSIQQIRETLGDVIELQLAQ